MQSEQPENCGYTANNKWVLDQVRQFASDPQRIEEYLEQNPIAQDLLEQILNVQQQTVDMIEHFQSKIQQAQNALSSFDKPKKKKGRNERAYKEKTIRKMEALDGRTAE